MIPQCVIVLSNVVESYSLEYLIYQSESYTLELFCMQRCLDVKWYLIQNSQAVKKVCGPQKGYGEKRCEIQGGGQEMAVMVG